MKSQSPPHKIDVEKIIREKNPRLLQWMPRFLLNYMKRIVHQEEFNAFLERMRSKKDHEFVSHALIDFEISVKSEGLENIPLNGGCILACNHPLGGIDGIAVMNELGKARKDMKALVNDILMNIENLNSLLIPVNKHGKNDFQHMKAIDRSYASEACTIVFPAGFVSRRSRGKIEDAEWKKSFISKAIRYQRPVVPVYIDSRNSDFFYRLASIRKKIGIKINIEMFYLVHETYKQRGKAIRIIFGKPIDPSTFTANRQPKEWAQYVKQKVYELH